MNECPQQRLQIRTFPFSQPWYFFNLESSEASKNPKRYLPWKGHIFWPLKHRRPRHEKGDSYWKSTIFRCELLGLGTANPQKKTWWFAYVNQTFQFPATPKKHPTNFKERTKTSGVLKVFFSEVDFSSKNFEETNHWMIRWDEWTLNNHVVFPWMFGDSHPCFICKLCKDLKTSSNWNNHVKVNVSGT